MRNDKELALKITQSMVEHHYGAQVNELYYHYKTPDRYYRVLHIGLDEETEKVVVIYQAQYGSHLVWVRDIDRWCDRIEIDNNTIVSRFIHHKENHQ